MSDSMGSESKLFGRKFKLNDVFQSFRRLINTIDPYTQNSKENCTSINLQATLWPSGGVLNK